MPKLWNTFCQSVTIALAVWFVVSTLRPDLLRGGDRTASAIPGFVTVRESAPSAGGVAGSAAPGGVSFRTAAQRAMPSVVHIYTTQTAKAPRHPLLDDPTFRRFFGDPPDEQDAQRSASLGSGVIVAPTGYVVTNHHVIESADAIEVALADGRKLKARLVGTDPESDLAVLKVDSATPLAAITFGRAETLQVGDPVLAIGNPFGVGQTVTMGIVSALGRSHLGINTFENFIQSDAAINPGNSGGALVDADGNLVGINSAIYSRTGGNLGIGFAIPVNLTRQVMDQLIASGGVTRGWIGVEVQDLTPELAESFKVPDASGTLIAGVLPRSPADRAGVQRGDVLIAIDGRRVTDSSAMLNLVASLKPGQKSALDVIRGGKPRQIDVTVARRPLPMKRPVVDE
jgi:serine protease DegQ